MWEYYNQYAPNDRRTSDGFYACAQKSGDGGWDYHIYKGRAWGEYDYIGVTYPLPTREWLNKRMALMGA